jgi:8-oxo-dGTP pyrophosphatase MutT (NUDIX family)
MVRKKHTYSFIQFVAGMYSFKDNNYSHASALVSSMTPDERSMILTCNFEYIWRQVWMGGRKNYFKSLGKYEKLMQTPSFINILRSAPVGGALRWEIPKGKKSDHDESELQAAIREFIEETGMKKENFKVYPDITHDDSYTDGGVRYTTRYFCAIGDFQPNRMYRFLNETSDVAWLDLEELRVTDRLGYSHMASIVKRVIRRIKREFPY